MQGRQSNQVNRYICPTAFSASPKNSRQEAPVEVFKVRTCIDRFFGEAVGL